MQDSEHACRPPTSLSPHRARVVRPPLRLCHRMVCTGGITRARGSYVRAGPQGPPPPAPALRCARAPPSPPPLRAAPCASACCSSREAVRSLRCRPPPVSGQTVEPQDINNTITRTLRVRRRSTEELRPCRYPELTLSGMCALVPEAARFEKSTDKL